MVPTVAELVFVPTYLRPSNADDEDEEDPKVSMGISPRRPLKEAVSKSPAPLWADDHCLRNFCTNYDDYK
jgi:hypothetical protein